MMMKVTRYISLWTILVAASGLFPEGLLAQKKAQKQKKSEHLLRCVWQDRADKSLHWGELTQAGASLVFQKRGPVPGFPQLDQERHELVQMERIDHVMLVGVRDNEGGKLQSDWVALDLGVDEHSHGDHSDFQYQRLPQVIASQLDQQQGNPAHLYVYDRAFYLANDGLNGFTRFTPQQLTKSSDSSRGTFHRGGGGHITLAAVDNQISYSTWIFSRDGEGGPVDVSDLTKTGEESLLYSFRLPSGGLHGATANSGKVFFAPAEGIYWVQADLQRQQTAETIQMHHLSLGEHPETKRPYRTGAFTNHRNWVLFTTGRGEDSALCLVNAAAENPEVIKLPIPVADGLSLTTPETCLTAGGKHYAFVFQNKQEGEVEEKLTIVDLDPNRDRNFQDAQIAKTISVGASKVEGHYGHHTISFDGDARRALLTNPGDGEIWMLSLSNLNILGKYAVGGMPTKIVVVGGKEHKH